MDPGDNTKVEIEEHFGRKLGNATLPAIFNLNVGLSGPPVNVGASTKGSVSAQLGYDLALGFGYDPAKGGFFVDPDSKASDFDNSLPNHELSLHNAGLNQFTVNGTPALASLRCMRVPATPCSKWITWTRSRASWRGSSASKKR